MKKVLLLAAAVALCSTAYAGGGVVKYEQPVDPDGFIYNSMNILDLYNCADDFVCWNGMPITDVHWWGGYFWIEGPNPIEGFNIRFYLDDGKNGYARPGTLVYDVIYPGNANERDTGMYGGDGFKIWEYFLNIEPFFQKEGETYWLSISCIPGWDPWQDYKFWGWRNAAQVTGYAGVQAYYTGDHQGMWAAGWEVTDFGFELTTVPEPATVTALAGLLLGLGGVLLRRK